MKERLRFDREAARLREEFFAGYIRKNSRAYTVVASVILLLEAAMITRALFVFDFGYWRHKLYFVSYIFLFCATLAALIFVLRNRGGRIKPLTMTLAQHLYCTAIIIWALLVAYLDLVADNTPIVFLTVIMSVAGLSVLHPLYYAVNVLASFAVLLSFPTFAEIHYFQEASRGIYLNLGIFALISVLLASRQYRVSRREYDLTRRLEALSFRDQLTGIFNRRMYDEAMERVAAEDSAAVIALFDLDAFKRINDTYGHDFGDTCLKEAAKQLREAFGDCVYRIGGDEFAAICDADLPDAPENRVEAINRRLETVFPGRSVSLSAGFFLRKKGADMSITAVVEAADKALYEAKKSGKRRGVLHRESGR